MASHFLRYYPNTNEIDQKGNNRSKAFMPKTKVKRGTVKEMEMLTRGAIYVPTKGPERKWPLQIRIQVRAWYYLGEPATVIAQRVSMMMGTEVTAQQMRLLCCSEGWSADGQDTRESKREAIKKQTLEWLELMGMSAEATALRAWKLIDKAIEEGNARNLKDAATGVKILMDISQQARGDEPLQQTFVQHNHFAFRGDAMDTAPIEAELTKPLEAESAIPAFE